VSRLAAVALMLLAMPAAAAGTDDLRLAADAFGQALVSKQTGGLRKVLPGTGKVELSLDRLGPEDGAFGPSQVQALFRDFLGKGSVRSFEIHQVEGDGRVHGVVHARLALIDRDGRPAPVGLRLAFQLEDGRWVLRGIKETSG